MNYTKKLQINKVINQLIISALHTSVQHFFFFRVASFFSLHVPHLCVCRCVHVCVHAYSSSITILKPRPYLFGILNSFPVPLTSHNLLCSPLNSNWGIFSTINCKLIKHSHPLSTVTHLGLILSSMCASLCLCSMPTCSHSSATVRYVHAYVSSHYI